MNANVDLVGIVLLLRRLIKRGVIGQIEGEKVTRRVAAQSGATIVILP